MRATVTAPQPYYQDEAVTIYHGDMRELLDTACRCQGNDACGGFRCGLSGTAPDLIIADPPYGVTSLTWDRWLTGWPAYIPGSSMWVFGTLRMFMDRAAEFHAWRMSQDIVWEKHTGSGVTVGRFNRVHEQAVHFYRGRWDNVYKSVPTTPDAVARTARRKALPPHHQGARGASVYVSLDGGPRLMRSVIKRASAHGYAENETQKPVGILTPLIEYGCPPGGLVLDPFMGSGSTLIAARDSGRRAIGIDVREDQCEIAANRCRWLAVPA